MSNILTRLGIAIEHFSEEERAAQAKAAAITTKVKALLATPTALTIEALSPQLEGLAPVVNEIVGKLVTTLQNPVISTDLDIVAGVLSRYGAKLTAALDANPKRTLGDYVVIFESLFNA